jgi:hypothetical protein
MEPQFDFRQALSLPEDKAKTSAETVHTAPLGSLAGAPATNQSEDAAGKVRLSRSQMTNISFVTVACAGGLACALYFFNGAEFLRAAAAWGREFLYSRPSAVAANIDISKQQSSPDEAGTPGTPSQSRARPSPFDQNIWPSTLSQPGTFANVSPVGNSPAGSAFSGVGLPVDQLNLLPRGADSLFQSFYQTAISMTPKNVARAVSRTTASARRKIASTQQNAAGQANAATAAASRAATKTAQQTASAQNQSATNAARAQSQSMMSGGPGGGGAGLGGMGLGGTGLGGTGLGGTGLGGVVGGLGHH